MPDTKLLASLLTLSAILLCPPPAHADKKEPTPEDKVNLEVTTGQPKRDGDVITVLKFKRDPVPNDDGLITKEEWKDIRGTGFGTGANMKLRVLLLKDRRTLMLVITSHIKKKDTPITKAQKIAKNINQVLDRLPRRLRGAEASSASKDTTPPIPLPKVHIWNLKGFQLSIDWAEKKNKRTYEKDVYATRHARSFSEDKMMCSLNLSGVPKGGQVIIDVEGKQLLALDTAAYADGNQIEKDLCILLSGHPLIRASLSSTDIATTSDMSSFDGQCVVLTENYALSYAVQVTDPGLSYELSFYADPRGDEIGTSYCSATLNSTGHPAQISAIGSADLADNDIVLEVSNVPVQFGFFFCGLNQIDTPFGEGRRCVGGGVIRLGRPQVAHGNQSSQTIDLRLIPSEFYGGSLNCQYWFRDPAGGGTNFNLSDAVQVTVL